MRGYKSMYDYRGKIAGGIVAALGAIGMLAAKFMHLIIVPKYNAEQHYFIFLWVTLLGLFTMNYSYEKREDERIKLIRARTLQIVYMMTIAVVMAQGFVGVLHPDYVIEGPILLFISAFSIVFYTIIFYIGVYFDDAWDYDDKVSIVKNFKENKIYILVSMIVTIILITLLATLFV